MLGIKSSKDLGAIVLLVLVVNLPLIGFRMYDQWQVSNPDIKQTDIFYMFDQRTKSCFAAVKQHQSLAMAEVECRRLVQNQNPPKPETAPEEKNKPTKEKGK